MSLDQRKVLLIGGGTGGHVVPIFEIYKKLKEKEPKLEITVVGGGGVIEKQFYNLIGGYKKILSGKLRRHLTLKNLIELLRFIIGFLQSLFILLYERPNLIFAKGGFVSLPMTQAAVVLRIPYFIHESDVEMGLANRLSAGRAKKIFLGFPPENFSGLTTAKVIYSGQIIRSDLISAKGKAEIFGFTSNQPTILILGGSQGALAINKAVAKIIPKLISHLNIIHQVGPHSLGWVGSFRQSLDWSLRQNYFVTDFLKIEGGVDRMLEAIALADLVITRAGANTTAELAQAGKAMILIPYPHAAGDHQIKNARILERSGGAIVITENELKPELLLEKINDLFADKSAKLKILGQNSRALLAENGLEVVVEEILKELATNSDG